MSSSADDVFVVILAHVDVLPEGDGWEGNPEDNLSTQKFGIPSCKSCVGPGEILEDDGEDIKPV
jgi:hypothetical protein